MTLRILIAVTHLLGAGHLRRAASLARAFAAEGHEATLVTGGMPMRLVPTDGIRLVRLPPVRIEGTEFCTLLDEAGRPVAADRMAQRRAMLLAAFRSLHPDVLITELFPFGRRVLADEFLALLEAARTRVPRPLVVASLRDILATPKKERVAETHQRVAAFYDVVLVHGDPRIVPLERSWPVDMGLRDRLRYTGYVDDAPGGASLPPRGDEIIVSGGSSAASLPLFHAAIEAARLEPRHPWRILVGEGVSAEAYGRLVAAAPLHALVERARSDFRPLLAAARLSISQLGYNTAVDLLRTRTPAVIVPFEGGHETEQRQRAERFAALGLAGVVPEEALSAQALAEAVRSALAAPPPPVLDASLDGARRSVAIIQDLLRAKTPVRPASHPAKPDWSGLDDMLRRLADQERSLLFWWRDDDAVAHTPALDRLLALAKRFGAPVALAVVPAWIERSLVERLAPERSAHPLVHGLAHANHAPAGEKKAEFGPHRPLPEMAVDAERALALARAAFGEKLLPVFVPPWNRFDRALAPALAERGYRGLSTFGRAQGQTTAGLAVVNTHLDPIDWRGGGGLADGQRLVDSLALAVAERSAAPAAQQEPLGLLTHHLVQDEAVWRFCEDLLERLSAHPNVRYPLPETLFRCPLEQARLNGTLGDGLS